MSSLRFQQRGPRSVAGVSAGVSGEVALPRDRRTPVGCEKDTPAASTTLNRLQANDNLLWYASERQSREEALPLEGYGASAQRESATAKMTGVQASVQGETYRGRVSLSTAETDCSHAR
jgi:hypothetical protein